MLVLMQKLIYSTSYRYDGLYKVAGVRTVLSVFLENGLNDWDQAKIKLGKSGHQVCLFRLEVRALYCQNLGAC